MFCSNCGSQNPDSATTCSACGMPIQNPYQASMAGAAPPVPSLYVPTYFVPAILTTLCCCPGGFVFGIVAMVYATKVTNCLSVGDLEGARRASNSARMWCWIAFAVGILIDVIFGHFEYTVNGVTHRFGLLQ